MAGIGLEANKQIPIAELPGHTSNAYLYIDIFKFSFLIYVTILPMQLFIYN